MDWGLTHVGCQLDLKGMVLQQVIPTEAGQGTLQDLNPNGTLSDQSGILTQMILEPAISLKGVGGIQKKC